MKFLYNAGIRLYGAGIAVASLRSDKARRLRQGRLHLFDDLERITAERAPEGYDYWFHVASLGEFEQARPLIETIRAEQPQARILLTFFSPSGYDVRHDYDRVDAVVYLPADTRANARRFLDIARPRQSVFIKYEFWLNFLDELGRRDVPTYLVSAIFRPGQIFFRPWGGTFRRRLGVYRRIYVQDEDSRALLASAGITDVRVLGDTRFDRVHDIMERGQRFPAVEQWIKGAFTLVVGSSWPADEDRYVTWVNSHSDVRVIIAPHEFDDRRLADMTARFTSRAVLWSGTENGTHIPNDAQVLIVNTFGLLSSLYRYASAVIVGGGFGAGIHNINEAAVYGTPILIGPRHQKFKEARDLIGLGGAFEYRTAEDAARLLNGFLDDPTARNTAADTARHYIVDNLGATRAICNDLLGLGGYD